jgi:hypothetical protein
MSLGEAKLMHPSRREQRKASIRTRAAALANLKLLRVYQRFMMVRASVLRALPRAAATLAVPMLVLSGCANMSDNVSTAFADPAKYELWDCKQLEPERKRLAMRTAELQGLMAKAETGAAGSVVAELAYRNDYVAVRGQSHYADEAWRRGNCRETPAAAAVPATVTSAPPSRAGGAVY